MNENIRKSVLAALIGGSMLTGAVVGAVAFGAVGANAATPSTGTAQRADASQAPGTVVSNEDPAHEATESAQREAQENAGQKPTVP
jgi:hypothetical protein